MSQNPLQEVELYAFASSSAQFFLTPHEFDVDLDGNRYQSLPLQRNELALGAEAAKSALELKLPPDGELVRHLLAASLTGDATSVTLRIGRKSEWGDDWWLSGTRWMGRVLGVEIADVQARIRCESAQVSLKRIGLRRLYSRKCSHVLYSAACGAAPISDSAVVQHCSGRSVTLDASVPGSVSGGLAGGEGIVFLCDSLFSDTEQDPLDPESARELSWTDTDGSGLIDTGDRFQWTFVQCWEEDPGDLVSDLVDGIVMLSGYVIEREQEDSRRVITGFGFVAGPEESAGVLYDDFTWMKAERVSSGSFAFDTDRSFTISGGFDLTFSLSDIQE